MASEENNPLSSEPSSGNSNSKPTGKGILIGLIVVSILALAAIGLGALNYMNQSNGQLKLDNTLKGFATNVQAQLDESANQSSELSPEQQSAIANAVIEKIKPTIESFVPDLVVNSLAANRESFLNDIAVLIPQQQTVNEGLTEQQVKDIANQLIDARTQRLSILIQNKSAEINRIEDEIEITSSAVETLTEHVNRLRRLERPNGSSDQVTNHRKRLKEFHIIDVLKDGELFIVEAPKRNGNDNTITLTINEPFRSKYVGRLKVESFEIINGTPRLNISKNWFIDPVREEASQAEIEAIQKKKNAQILKQKEAKLARKAKEKEAARIAKTKSETVWLKGWKVITPIKEANRVVVFNPNSEKAEKLHVNSYVKGVGTVKKIDFITGETCFEQYCIAGLGQ
ncbi:hypothetical protein [Vibrio sp. R78045]|uniref:hypothetical protein n=1 Tax=Vibrio sp. R78045 TaxID=3093868 RepID=UPI0036F1B162